MGDGQTATDEHETLALTRLDLRKPYTQRFSKNVWPHEKPPNGELAELYAPAVAPLHHHLLSELLITNIPHDPMCNDFRYVTLFLSDPEFHGGNPPTPVHEPKSALLPDEQKALVNASLSEPYSGPSTFSTVRAFMRREMKKDKFRRRTIFHTICANDTGRMPAPRLMQVRSYHILFSMTGRKKFGAGRDFKSFYHQFEFDPKVREILRYRYGDALFQLTRAAMGHKASAAAAHTTSKAIVLLALHRARKTPSDVHYDIIIDDVLFMSDSLEDLTAVCTAFDEICSEIHATIGTFSPPTTLLTHRGVEFDFEKRLRRVKTSTIDRLRARFEYFSRSPTLPRLRSIIGAVMFCRTIMCIDVGDFLRAAIRAELTSQVPDPTIYRTTIDLVLANDWVHNVTTDTLPYGGTVVTDATLTHWAAIFVDQQGEVITSTGVVPEGPIHVSEALATLYALDSLPSFDVPHRVEFVTDNTVWLFSMHRSYARCDELQPIRSEFLGRLRLKNIFPVLAYIASADNPADNPSRGIEVDVGQLRRARSVAEFLQAK